MEWRDEALILHVKPLGECKVILDLMTKCHGRHMGVTAVSKKGPSRGTMQPGNKVHVCWKARVSEQLGHFSVELLAASGALLIMHPLGMQVFRLSSLSLRLFLPERAAYFSLYAHFDILTVLCSKGGIECAYAHFEMRLLEALGFSLDLETCVVTGAREHLRYVSPKSGCAVSVGAAAPYVKKLLRLPEFLVYNSCATPVDLRDSYKLTGYFLEKNLSDLPRFSLWRTVRNDVIQALLNDEN